MTSYINEGYYSSFAFMKDKIKKDLFPGSLMCCECELKENICFFLFSKFKVCPKKLFLQTSVPYNYTNTEALNSWHISERDRPLAVFKRNVKYNNVLLLGLA